MILKPLNTPLSLCAECQTKDSDRLQQSAQIVLVDFDMFLDHLCTQVQALPIDSQQQYNASIISSLQSISIT